MLYPVILCGGSGTRLWPLSNDREPKQFLRLTGPNSLFQETVLRVPSGPDVNTQPIIVSNQNHQQLLERQLAEIDRRAESLILEPAGRNTAPAIAAAARLAIERDPSAILLVMPADHIIGDQAAFHKAIGVAVEAAASGRLATFGIVPSHAETGYGYIMAGRNTGFYRLVDGFVEKPDAETAKQYVADGNYFWNSGMFVFKAATFLQELQSYRSDIDDAVARAVGLARVVREITYLDSTSFADCPSDSIDYAVMERTERAAVVPLDAQWSDVGSWDALYDALTREESDSVHIGSAVEVDGRGNLLISSGRRIVVAGIDNSVVISTDDEVLVIPRNRSQQVKELAALAKRAGASS